MWSTLNLHTTCSSFSYKFLFDHSPDGRLPPLYRDSSCPPRGQLVFGAGPIRRLSRSGVREVKGPNLIIGKWFVGCPPQLGFQLCQSCFCCATSDEVSYRVLLRESSPDSPRPFRLPSFQVFSLWMRCLVGSRLCASSSRYSFVSVGVTLLIAFITLCASFQVPPPRTVGNMDLCMSLMT